MPEKGEIKAQEHVTSSRAFGDAELLTPFITIFKT
jgi:hypothetical protein